MEATVTMALADYDRLKEQISDLQSIVRNNKDIFGSLEVTFEENEALIAELRDYVMDRAYAYNGIDSELEEKLHEHYCGGILEAFYSHYVKDFSKFGITLEMQREYATRRYNEYQAQKQQEELENGSK